MKSHKEISQRRLDIVSQVLYNTIQLTDKTVDVTREKLMRLTKRMNGERIL